MLDHYVELPDGYYRQDHYFDFVQFFAAIPRQASVLNAGCGLGLSLHCYPNGVGVDFNPNLGRAWERFGLLAKCHRIDIAQGLPWSARHFDWTLSTDFLEHVQPGAVQPVLLELGRVGRRGLHVIDTCPESRYRGPNGENLHPSAGSESSWIAAFEQAGMEVLGCKRLGAHLFISVQARCPSADLDGD